LRIWTPGWRGWKASGESCSDDTPDERAAVLDRWHPAGFNAVLVLGLIEIFRLRREIHDARWE
jgi:hypothetical protein